MGCSRPAKINAESVIGLGRVHQGSTGFQIIIAGTQAMLTIAVPCQEVVSQLVVSTNVGQLGVGSGAGNIRRKETIAIRRQRTVGNIPMAADPVDAIPE